MFALTSQKRRNTIPPHESESSLIDVKKRLGLSHSESLKEKFEIYKFNEMKTISNNIKGRFSVLAFMIRQQNPPIIPRIFLGDNNSHPDENKLVKIIKFDLKSFTICVPKRYDQLIHSYFSQFRTEPKPFKYIEPYAVVSQNTLWRWWSVSNKNKLIQIENKSVKKEVEPTKIECTLRKVVLPKGLQNNPYLKHLFFIVDKKELFKNEIFYF